MESVDFALFSVAATWDALQRAQRQGVPLGARRITTELCTNLDVQAFLKQAQTSAANTEASVQEILNAIPRLTCDAEACLLAVRQAVQHSEVKTITQGLCVLCHHTATEIVEVDFFNASMQSLGKFRLCRAALGLLEAVMVLSQLRYWIPQVIEAKVSREVTANVVDGWMQKALEKLPLVQLVLKRVAQMIQSNPSRV